jgi:hypothetical protein
VLREGGGYFSLLIVPPDEWSFLTLLKITRRLLNRIGEWLITDQGAWRNPGTFVLCLREHFPEFFIQNF